MGDKGIQRRFAQNPAKTPCNYVPRNPWVGSSMLCSHRIIWDPEGAKKFPNTSPSKEIHGRLQLAQDNFSRICWYLLIVIEYKGISLKQFQNLTGKTAVSNHQLTIYDLWNYLWSPGKHGKVATNLPRTTPWHWWEMLVLAVDESNHPRCSLGV